MSDQDAGEYDLAEDPEEPRKAKPPVAPPVKPLPRLWKTEPDEDEAPEDAPGAKKEEPPPEAKRTVRPAAAPKRTRPGAGKDGKSSSGGDGAEKKVLVEDTPAFDTYQARQRGRLLVGGLIAGCVLIFGYVFYQLFHDPNPIELTSDEPPPPPVVAVPKRDLDVEARSMFERARDSAKAGRTEQAVELLTTLTKSYKGTKTAGEAKEALERPKQNLPLFLDRPTVKADAAAPPEPAPQPPPPQVVNVEPKQAKGNATLTLPANPAEPTATQPSPLAMATTPDTSTRPAVPVRPPPAGFKASAQAGVHASGWPLAIVGDRDGATMVFVPGGTFTMGNDGGQPAEGPAHKVQMSPYYIDQHEVTVRQFRLFLAESHYRGEPQYIGKWSEEFRQNPDESLPMVLVNAHDAKAFADWALKMLPTEAQWELAARSTDGRPFPWGSEPSKLAKPAGAAQVGPVMAVPADLSPYGAFDMGGNALEWTKDWYDSKYYRQLPLGGVTNPLGPTVKPRSLELVVKGDRKTGSASSRQPIALDKRLGYVSFRCVLPVPEQGDVFTAAPGAPGQVPAAVAPGPGQPGASPRPAGKTDPPPPPF